MRKILSFSWLKKCLTLRVLNHFITLAEKLQMKINSLKNLLKNCKINRISFFIEIFKHCFFYEERCTVLVSLQGCKSEKSDHHILLQYSFYAKTLWTHFSILSGIFQYLKTDYWFNYLLFLFQKELSRFSKSFKGSDRLYMVVELRVPHYMKRNILRFSLERLSKWQFPKWQLPKCSSAAARTYTREVASWKIH